MAIVVEVLNRSGHVISTHKYDSQKVEIGRGLDADLTLHDPHVDAHHLVIECMSESHNLYCEDLHSLNGVWLLSSKRPGYGITLKNKNRLTQRRLFYSGQQFMLGRTILRVYVSDHPVASPIPLSKWEDIGHRLSHWGIWVSAGLCIVVLQSLSSYFNNPTQDNLLQYILPSGYALIGALTYAGVWAFVGRNLRHEGKFLTHLSVALLTVLMSVLVNFSLPVVLFNTGFWWLSDFIDSTFSALLAFAGIWLALLYSTQLKKWPRLSVSMIAPAAILLSVVIGALTRPEFRSAPPYEKALVGPSWQWREPVTLELYSQSAAGLFDQVLAERDSEELQQ